jgi:hypothetical protein
VKEKTVDTEKHVFDLKRVSREIYGYMRIYALPENHKHNQDSFIKGLEQLLLKEVMTVIELNMNILIRKTNIDYAEYERFSRKFDIDQIDLENIIDSALSFRCITDKINSVMGNDSFSIWTLTACNGVYVFETLGDFRILEWYNDHVRYNSYHGGKQK